jgi:hypothetical protein
MELLEDSNERSIVFGRPRGAHERLWTMKGYWEVQEVEMTVSK